MWKEECEVVATGGELGKSGNSPTFGKLLVGLQEEHWAVCRDRQYLQIENRELKQRLERASACRHSKCHLDEPVEGTSVAEVVELASAGGPSSPCTSDLGVVAEEGGLPLAADDGLRDAGVTGGADRPSDADVEFEAVGLNSPVLPESRQCTWPPNALLARRLSPRQVSPDGSHASTFMRHSDSRRSDFVTQEATDATIKVDAGVSSSGLLLGCDRLFPDWWNPQPLLGADFSGEDLIMEEKSTANFMVSPVSRRRLLWDLVAALILLYETWAVPLRLVYMSEDVDLPWMQFVDRAILVFFALDIVLNFNTGVLERGRVNFQRSKAANHYMRCWFWVDFVSTFPFDLIVASTSGELTSLLRILRFAKLFKTFRYLRLLKMKRALLSSEDGVALMGTLRSLCLPCGMLFGLLFLVHVYTCVWSALRHDLSQADDYSGAMREYVDDFRAVYGALYAFKGLKLVSAPEIIFDMVIAVHRIFFVLCFASWVVFTTLLKFEVTARLQMKTDHALSYLRRHKVPANMQVQVLYGLYEAGDAKEMQKDFTYLMESNLPTELQRTITSQLWTPKLASLGLIRIGSSWHPQLVEELAAVCFEEVLASSSALFREGDLGFSAYLVLSGELQIKSIVRTLSNQDYKAGMWLGENALVNPTYRRGFSAYTMSLVSVMNVSSQAFWKVLEKLGIDKLFEDWCTKELWRGLCGRCGSVGDHFADECGGSTPVVYHSVSGRRSMEEVREYLRRHDIEPLLPLLEDLGIHDLKSLQELDPNTLQGRVELGQLTRPFGEVKNLFSMSHIEHFKQSRQKGMKMLLETQTKDHLIFISHFKIEAGTEAALLRSELQNALKAEQEGRSLAAPVFLDSDDLATLKEIQDRVGRSSNVILLLTTGVLTRPWVLVEMVTAYHLGINVQLVDIIKPGNSFNFPDHQYYQKLVSGQIMDQDSLAVLAECNIDILEVEHCLREIFKSISVPYSPHRPDKIRKAEIKALLGRCNLQQAAPVPARSVWGRRQNRPSHSFAMRAT